MTLNEPGGYSDMMAMFALAAQFAEYDRPDCRCQVETSYEPATPENGQIRDCFTILTNAAECPIERHRNPYARHER